MRMLQFKVMVVIQIKRNLDTFGTSAIWFHKEQYLDLMTILQQSNFEQQSCIKSKKSYWTF